MPQHPTSRGVGKTNSLRFRQVDVEFGPDQLSQNDPNLVTVEVMDLRPSSHPSIAMMAHSFVSVTDNMSIDSEVASVMFQTGINDMNDISNSDRPGHWDLATDASRSSRATPSSAASTSNESRISLDDTTINNEGRKKNRVVGVLVGIVVLVLAVEVIFYLLTDSMFLFGGNGLLGGLFGGSIEEKLPGADRRIRSIERMNLDQQIGGELLRPTPTIGQSTNQNRSILKNELGEGGTITIGHPDYSDRVMLSRKRSIDLP